MKRLTILAVITFFITSFISCGKMIKSDPAYITVYSYKNSTSDKIYMEVYSPIYKDYVYVPDKELKFEIPAGGKYDLDRYSMGNEASHVLIYLNYKPLGRDSTIVTKGNVSIIQRSWEGADLYKKEGYSRKTEGKATIIYTFEFTDEFFEQ